MEVIDFDSQVPHPPDFTTDQARSKKHPPDHGQRLDVALQRHLHLAEGTEKIERASRPKKSAVRRSSSCRTATTPPAWSSTTKSWISRSARRRRSTRSACGSRASGAATSRKRSSCCGSCRRKPAAGCSSRPTSPSCRRSTSRSPRSWPASTAIAYSSKNPLRNGAWRRIVVRMKQARASPRARARATYGPAGR